MWAARCAGWSAQTGAESTCPLSLHPRRGLRSRQVAGQRRRYDARRGLVHFIRRLASAVRGSPADRPHPWLLPGGVCAPGWTRRERSAPHGNSTSSDFSVEDARLYPGLATPRAEGTPQSRNARGETIFRGGEAPAHVAFALRAERRTGRESQSVLAHETLAECEAVAHAFDPEEGVHGSRGKSRFHPGDSS